MSTRAALLRLACLALIALVCLVAALPAAQTPPPPAKRLPPAGIKIPDAARTELTAGAAALQQEIADLDRDLAAKNSPLHHLLPDVALFHKAVDWALRYDEFFNEKEIAAARRLLKTGHDRAAALRAGNAPWLQATGMVLRAHRSALDGSIQPYALYLPPTLPKDRPERLLVWLLGRGEKRTELAFLNEREGKTPDVLPRDTVVLIPYGRFCNATKFAGEVDVMEALAAVRTERRIDENRIAVAGFSMGGASTWHLATHYPGLWCAAAPGAGFAETAVYASVFAPNKPTRTPWEQTLWRWYDATGYAANLFNVPTIAYSGELDRQKQAADIMAKSMSAEGLTLEHLIGPKTEHKYESETKKVLVAKLEALLDQGRGPARREIRHTTYTLRYAENAWLRLEGLGKHWERADVSVQLTSEGMKLSTQNVTALSLRARSSSLTIDGQKLPAPTDHGRDLIKLVRENGEWRRTASFDSSALAKRPGLTGPIDDAFMAPFLFVRPTGQPLNSTLAGWTAAELKHATKLWRDLFRGDAPTKDDTALTDADIAAHNLILWGDPSSNAVLKRLLAAQKLPLTWTARELTFRGQTYDAAHHAPILIFPNPLTPAGAPPRYIVLNSGMDFRDEAYGTNSLQTPKLPDYAIVDLREPPGPRWPGKIVLAGFFDESWK